MDLVRKLILEKLEELDLTMSEASLKIGKNHAYLQQFLKRGYPLELPEKSRIPLARLLGVTEQELRGPSSSLPTRPRNNNHNAPPPERPAPKGMRQNHAMSSTGHNFVDSVRPYPTMGATDLPIFGTAQAGGDGALIVSDRPVAWENRPDFLAKVEDAYGMIVSGDSMEPELHSGSTLLVNPHLPPRNGDVCIFRSHKDDGEVTCMVKQLSRSNDANWYVHQHNPKKDFVLKRSEWQVCHVAVGNFYRR